MEYLRRYKNFWSPDWMALVWLVLAIPALYFFQTTIHEGTHAVGAFLVTGSFPKLAPFPHLSASGDPRNGVTLGDNATAVSDTLRTDCDSPAKHLISRLAGFIALPQFVDLALIVILSLVFLFTSAPGALARFPLRLWFLAAIADFVYNTARGLYGGCNAVADWSRFMLWYDINPALFALMTWIFWLLILSHFAWVYWSPWGQSETATSFWDYRWIAFACGVLSFLAVVLSLAVGDPDIDKSSALYILPLVIQFLSLGWYWTYFGLTYRYGRA